MTNRKFALSGVAAVALTSLLASPAFAFTHHPATAEEIQQTDALNAQALANARMGTTAAQPTASTSLTTGVQAPATPVAPDNGAATTTEGGDAATPRPSTATPAAPVTPPAPTPPATPSETSGGQ